MVGYFVVFLLLFFASAFFSATEIAFFSLTPAQIKNLVDKKIKSAKLVWQLRDNPQKLLITILIGNNIVNTLAASLATLLATRIFGSAGVGIATGVITLLVLIFGEIVPKTLAQKNNSFLALRSAKVIYFLSLFFAPVIWLLSYLNNFISKKLIKSKESSLVTEEEIRALARLGAEKGVIDYRERELIENVFRFNDVTVKEILTPRYKVTVLNGNVPVEQIAYFVAQSGFSRYPVYDGDEYNIIGYIHANDLMKVLNSDKREKLVKELVRPLRRIKSSTKIESLFRQMLKNKEHLALVVRDEDDDDIVGIVTLEDILEELVGEIRDETDKEKEVKKL